MNKIGKIAKLGALVLALSGCGSNQKENLPTYNSPELDFQEVVVQNGILIERTYDGKDFEYPKIVTARCENDELGLISKLKIPIPSKQYYIKFDDYINKNRDGYGYPLTGGDGIVDHILVRGYHDGIPTDLELYPSTEKDKKLLNELLKIYDRYSE